MQSSLKKHFQLVVFRKMLGWKWRNHIRETKHVTRPPPKISLKHEWKRELASEHAQRSEVGQPLSGMTRKLRKMEEKRPVPRRSMFIVFTKNLFLRRKKKGRPVIETSVIHARSHEVHKDSNVGNFATRRGLGRQRHVSTRFLCLQDKVSKGELKMVKVGKADQLADFLTKPVAARWLAEKSPELGLEFREGRSSLQRGLVSWHDLLIFPLTHIRGGVQQYIPLRTLFIIVWIRRRFSLSWFQFEGFVSNATKKFKERGDPLLKQTQKMCQIVLNHVLVMKAWDSTLKTKHFVKERGDPLLIMTIWVMSKQCWMRWKWTSEFQGYHILLWSIRRVSAFENWFRKLRTTQIYTLFNKIYDKIKLVTRLFQNQRKWFRKWAASNCLNCSRWIPKSCAWYAYHTGM